MPIRLTGRTAHPDCADRGSNPRWAALPPRTAAAPLSYSGRPGSAPGGGSTCSYSNSGREGGPRSRLLRVRLPPSTPGICSQIRLLSVNGKHASLVRRQVGVRFPRQAPHGRRAARKARRSHHRGRGFGSRRPLHVTVVSAVSTRACQVRRASSNLVGHSGP
jgi:hypothetical protein